MKYPKIYLALDNCFALKRWVEPETWLPGVELPVRNQVKPDTILKTFWKNNQR